MVDNAFAGLGTTLNTPNPGRLLENLVFLELFRRRQKLNVELFYYKKNTEVDFVIYGNQVIQELIQVSLTLNDQKTRNREIRALQSAARELHPLRMTIITLNEKQEIITDSNTIQVLPVTEWLTGD